MPAYSGKFQYLDESGGTVSQGPCQFSFDEETAVLTPASGAPIAFDLGDVDRATPGEWDLGLTLYTGRTLQLGQFGAAFGRMSQELLAAWHDRTVQCLLLEDVKEVARFQAVAAGTPAEIRIYESNLAVLPVAGLPIQWRLAEVESFTFDDSTYAATLQSRGNKLVISKLAKKTEEFLGAVQSVLDQIRKHSAEVLHRAFPCLNPDQLQRLVTTMPKGRSVPLKALAAIHPRLPQAILERAVGPALKPYFDALHARAAADALMTGFKFVRPEDAETADEEPPELFFWFFFPLQNGIVAWEASTGTGRATYFFRRQWTRRGRRNATHPRSRPGELPPRTGLPPLDSPAQHRNPLVDASKTSIAVASFLGRYAITLPPL